MNETRNDEMLIRTYREEGDETAFTTLCNRHREKLRAGLARCGCPEVDSTLKEVFAHLRISQERFVRGYTVEMLLYQLAEFCCHARKQLAAVAMNTVSDEKLIQLYRDTGEECFFEIFQDRYGEGIREYIKRRGCPNVETILKEVFAHLRISRERFFRNTSLRPFIFKIACRCCKARKQLTAA